MKILLASICAGVVLLAGPLGGVFATSAPLKIVTTTEDLAAIARDIGGDAVTVEAIARGYHCLLYTSPSPRD